MDEILLFTDGSVDTKSKTGYGAYLLVTVPDLSLDTLKDKVRIRRFEGTSSTKLELETLLWALSDIQTSGQKLIIYTDSQNIVGLHGRRERLEKNNYISKNNKLLRNHDLYREFFRITDQLDCNFIKVKGHKKSNQKNDIDMLFTLVDRASRDAQREERK